MEHSEDNPPQQPAQAPATPVSQGAAVTPSSSPPSPGFRWGVWLAVAAVVAAGVAMVLPREHKDRPPGAGAVVDLALTLITSDRADVACSSAQKFERYACDFSDDTNARKLSEADTLRPYMTLDRHVFLIPGLFLDPKIQQRYQAEPPTGPRDQLRRFTAKCKVKLAGRLQRFKLRWAATGAWSEPQDADIGTLVGCEVEGDPPAPRPATATPPAPAH